MAEGTSTVVDVVVADEPSATVQPKKAAGQQMPKWEAEARDRVRWPT
jgi:hypothetical protein